MRFVGLWRIALMTAGLMLAASATSAQPVDEGNSNVSSIAKTISVAPLSTQAATEALSSASRTTPSPSARRAEAVPYPRAAPNRTRAPLVIANASPTSVPAAEAPISQYAYAAPSAAVTAAFALLEQTRPREHAAASSTQVVALVPMPPIRPQPKDQARLGELDPTDIAILVDNTAVAHDVPLELAHAVVRVESNYNPRATGHDGTVGLMQIKPRTARGLGYSGSVRELYNPRTNIEWGIRYLAGARKLAKGNVCRTVLKYQGGHGAERMTNASSVYCGKVKTLIARPVARFAARP
jgi:soluble lytic murein transglycosylase-like protein